MELVSAIRRRVFPSQCLLDMFDGQTTINGSINDFLERRDGPEAYAIRLLCDKLYVAGDPLRSHFKDAVVESPERRSLQFDLQDVYGVSASKCVVKDFHLMAQTSSIRDMIEEHNYDITSLVTRIERENVGALPARDLPVILLHQEWNDRCWIGNSGSSHKLASLWFWNVNEVNHAQWSASKDRMHFLTTLRMVFSEKRVGYFLESFPLRCS